VFCSPSFALFFALPLFLGDAAHTARGYKKGEPGTPFSGGLADSSNHTGSHLSPGDHENPQVSKSEFAAARWNHCLCSWTIFSKTLTLPRVSSLVTRAPLVPKEELARSRRSSQSNGNVFQIDDLEQNLAAFSSNAQVQKLFEHERLTTPPHFLINRFAFDHGISFYSASPTSSISLSNERAHSSNLFHTSFIRSSLVAVVVLDVGLAAEEADDHAGEVGVIGGVRRSRGASRGGETTEREAPGCRGGDLCAS